MHQRLSTDGGTVVVEFECETIIFAEEANMISISMQNVCSLPSKLDIPDFIEFIEPHTINCFIETKINYIDIDNITMPEAIRENLNVQSTA